MHRLSQLLEKIPGIAQTKLAAPGIGVWLVWEGQLSTVVSQIFTEFGGFPQAQEEGQALWYFFGDEAFRALARLSGYARINKLPLFVEALPASLHMGYKFETACVIDEVFRHQEAQASQGLDIFAHQSLTPLFEDMLGQGFKESAAVAGEAPAGFIRFSLESNLGQDSPLGWYYMLRPLGDPLDKHTAEGWRAIFSELQGLLESLGVKYISHDGYLIFGIDNIRALRTITKELLQLEEQIKNGVEGKKYWPCVIACTSKKGFHLNKDLPRRINLDWQQLTPDYPHMSFRSALYLGPGFHINDVRHATGHLSIDDWCHISNASDLQSGEEGAGVGLKLPANLLAGVNPPCFYCGLANHTARDCPTRSFSKRDPLVWDKVAMQDMAVLEAASVDMEGELSSGSPEGLSRILGVEDVKSIMLRTLFEIGAPCQLRFLESVWRATGKDLPSGLDQIVSPNEDEAPWDTLDLLRRGEELPFEQAVTQHLADQGRGFYPRSIQGFMAMETGDWSRAAYFWQEAARGAYTPLQRGWLALLEGRALEVQGDYQGALGLYRQAKSECTRWAEPQYRRGVCMVKMGFTDQGLSEFMDLIRKNPDMFNRVLLDPELERGRIHILKALRKPWNDALAARNEKAMYIKGLHGTLKGWFREDHPFLAPALERATTLVELAKINNYACFDRLVREFESLQHDLQQTVEKGILSIGNKLKYLHEQLRDIHHEAAWFPFGKLLREFNKDYNACASKLNWMRTNSLRVAANFRKSQDYVDEIEAAIALLNARLVTLRIVRDSTLFILLLGKSFMWLELIGLALSLVCVPAVIYLAQYAGQMWLADMLQGQKWQIQKGLVIIVSIAAMALAAIKTAVTFEKRRAQLFKEEEAKERRGKPQPAKAAKALPAGKAAAAQAKPSGAASSAGKGKGK